MRIVLRVLIFRRKADVYPVLREKGGLSCAVREGRRVSKVDREKISDRMEKFSIEKVSLGFEKFSDPKILLGENSSG
jgi:hypothetical protein